MSPQKYLKNNLNAIWKPIRIIIFSCENEYGNFCGPVSFLFVHLNDNVYGVELKWSLIWVKGLPSNAYPQFSAVIRIARAYNSNPKAHTRVSSFVRLSQSMELHNGSKPKLNVCTSFNWFIVDKNLVWGVFISSSASNQLCFCLHSHNKSLIFLPNFTFIDIEALYQVWIEYRTHTLFSIRNQIVNFSFKCLVSLDVIQCQRQLDHYDWMIFLNSLIGCRTMIVVDADAAYGFEKKNRSVLEKNWIQKRLHLYRTFIVH